MTRADDLVPLLESADESAEVLSLLRADAADGVSDYDFDAGLAQHLGAITAPAAAAAAGSLAPSGGTLSTKALVAAIGLPIASVSVAVALWLGGGSAPPTPARNADATLEGRAPSPVAAAAPHTPPVAGTQVTGTEVAGKESEVPPVSDDASAAARSGTSRLRAGARVPGTRRPPAASSNPAARVILLEVDEGARAAAANAARGQTVDEGPRQRAALLREAAPSDTEQLLEAPEESESEAQAEARREAEAESRDRAQDRLRRDREQLMEAKRALGAEPKRALDLARRGEQEFPASVLAQERRHVLILALIGVGRRDEARRLAAPYLTDHPDSPFALRVRAALEGRPASSRP